MKETEKVCASCLWCRLVYDHGVFRTKCRLTRAVTTYEATCDKWRGSAETTREKKRKEEPG